PLNRKRCVGPNEKPGFSEKAGLLRFPRGVTVRVAGDRSFGRDPCAVNNRTPSRPHARESLQSRAEGGGGGSML
ncbi:MAG: hypothetical protein ACREJB_08715, partial [Planctomycetaceae bacterium]